ncbi:GATA transcription factor 1-like isoform X2 [Cornus florida]|uniref:GATA transcription factor 1-like isoform X2 n=1 Tax=Cornus florida TaxID=4283 RepID=UPI0028992192|nr:GATA transcription factor 1-like isoform X2 [Cornus florida]
MHKSSNKNMVGSDLSSMVGSDLFGGIDNCEIDVSNYESFGKILSCIDFPLENFDINGGDLDDAMSQHQHPYQEEGSIHSDAMQKGLLFVPGGAEGSLDIGNGTLDFLPNSDETSKPKQLPRFVEETSGASITLLNDSSDGLDSGMFQTPSPVSVLENSGSCSVEKSKPDGSEASIPVRRSKRSRAFSFKIQPEMSNFVKGKAKKKKRLSQLFGAPRMKKNSCTHCEVTKTPQWRWGPMGPRTLCNACGVRYKSGRLFPEYRPASSPTFDHSLHSNSHRKVIEMRKYVTSHQETTMAETDSAMSPPPEFVPMSDYLFD